MYLENWKLNQLNLSVAKLSLLLPAAGLRFPVAPNLRIARFKKWRSQAARTANARKC